MSSKRIIAVGMIAFLLVASCATFAFAQSGNTVSGYIRDSTDNRPISGAQIRVESTTGPSDYTAYSDGSGHYSLNIPPGDYRVRVTHNDYNQWETDFTMGTMPESRDIYLDHMGGGDNFGGDNQDGGFDMPFGDMDESILQNMIFMLIALVATFFICLITITIALMVISSRLGKIRKELVALNESQKPKVQPAPMQLQYQPPPPPPME